MSKELRYVIIGAGMAGILAGIKLLERGEKNFTILEKASRERLCSFRSCRFRINPQTNCPDGIVTGSSRSMMVCGMMMLPSPMASGLSELPERQALNPTKTFFPKRA